MAENPSGPKELFPELFEPVYFGATLATFETIDTIPDPHLISNVMIVPFTDKGWVAIRTAEFGWGFPGGTLEPGEGWQDGLHREAMEEAGVEVLSFHPFAVHRFDASERYRPHLPFPVSLRLIGTGLVKRVADPKPVDGGETVLEVAEMPLEDLVAAIRADGSPAASLVKLAARYADEHDLPRP